MILFMANRGRLFHETGISDIFETVINGKNVEI